jgi:hypothetical protein
VAVKCTRPATVRFVQVRNEWARDRRVGYKERGLLTYLHSHADGYELSLAQIIRDSTDGKDAVRTGLAKLEEAGYLTQVRGRGEGGRWGEVDYVLADPFDAAGQLLPQYRREIRTPDAADQREIRQSGLSAADNPRREIRPIEEQGENTKTPTESLSAAGQLRLVEHPSAAELFDAFWAAYPKKVGKDAARRAWTKAARRADPGKIIDVVSRYPFRSERQFVKDPATWLNAGCWEDDLEAVAAANGPRSDRDQRVTGANYGPRYQDPDPRTHPDAFSGSF